MGAFGDPVQLGFVASLAHPGGNITGLTVVVGQLHAKRLELLKTALPEVVRVAVVWNAANPSNLQSFLPEAEQATQVLGLEFQPVSVPGANSLAPVFEEITRLQVDALATLADGELLQRRAEIAQFALDRRLPTLFPEREFAEAGGLMAYGPYIPNNFRRAAYYVDRILKGAKPADLPVEQPREFDFVINLQTAQALGLTIPEHVLVQATEVLQ